MLLSIIIASVIGAAFVAIIVCGIINKKKGKSSCSCGGNCGACGLCHSQAKDNKAS